MRKGKDVYKRQVMYGAKSLVDYSAVGVFQNFNLIAEIIKYSYKKVPVNREHVGNENCMCFSHFLSERSIAHIKTVPFLKCGEQTAEPYFYSSQICDLINFYLCIDTPVLFEN